MPNLLALMALAAAASISVLGASASSTREMPRVKLWRLDGGQLGEKHTPDSCYLVKHGNTYMLWDAGLDPDLANKVDQLVDGRTLTMGASLPQQLKMLGLKPEDISIIAISHAHYDHVEGARSFPNARLLIGRLDYETLMAKPSMLGRQPQEMLDGLRPWIQAGSAKELVDGDLDIFGDGSVVMLNTPGHTSGHHSLLLKLRRSGFVLLTGDLYHNRGEYAAGVAPKNITDPAATAESDQRIKALAAEKRAIVVIPHEAKDIDKLPPFPKAAD